MRNHQTNIGNFTLRLGNLNDISALMSLNKDWLVDDLHNCNKTDGFLFGDAYSYDDFKYFVTSQEIVVAENDNNICGYYLFDNYSDNGTTRLYGTILNALKNKGVVGQDKICRRAQVAIDRKYQNLDLSRQLLSLLVEQNRHKYNTVFSVVAKDNPKMKAHEKIGWTIVDEDEHLYFVILTLT